MADLVPTLKRWAFIWPLAVSVFVLLGFRAMSPNARIAAVEEAQAKVPALVKEAIDSQVAPLKAAIEAQRVRDSITQEQLQSITRSMTLNTLLQCRQLPQHDADFLRQLAIACDRTSQRSGIPYRRP